MDGRGQPSNREIPTFAGSQSDASTQRDSVQLEDDQTRLAIGWAGQPPPDIAALFPAPVV
jgi:hypothetical protein